MIHLDADANTIDVDLSEEELKARRDSWTMPPYKTSRGTLHVHQECEDGQRRLCDRRITDQVS